MDIFSKCIEQNYGYFYEVRHFKEMNPKLSLVMTENGLRTYYKDKPVIAWSYNNYLGLSNHPSNREIEKYAIQENSSNYPMGSRFLTGNSQDLENLELTFSSFVEKEQAMLCATGYLAAVGVIPALAREGDIIVIDAEAHACLFDGARIAVANGAKLLLFKHNDLESLENKLKIAKEQRSGGILIITDGIFSMKGDMAPLKDIIHLKKKYEARLFVDDAHGGGVMGEQGRGTSHFLKVSQDVDLLMYIFSKAFGSIGGIICGNASIISYLRFNSRTNIFSHNMTSIHARKTLNSLYLLQSTPSLLEDLCKNTYLLQKMLQENGFNIGTTNSPITPIFLRNTLGIPDIEYLYKVVMSLREQHGVFVSGVTYPAVPKGINLLRLIPTSNHTEEEIKKTVFALQEVLALC